MVRTVIGTLADTRFAVRYAEPLFRLRYEVFHERLHWDVRCRDQMETDEYDDLWTRYVVAVDGDDQVLGGWRLRPTIGNYMLADVFPQLLYGTPAPHHPRVWESNRFVCDKRAAKRGGFGFGEAALALFRATCEFGMANGIDEYIMVLSAGVVRLTRATGLRVHEYGPPVRIGDVLSVGCRIRVDAHSRHVLFGEPLPLERAA
jgi:acyl homoserine lactone synthase